jgi:hypothetical protein
MSVLLLCRSQDGLPGNLTFDALEAILGHLSPCDRRTARFVNSAFQAAVATHFRVVDVPKPCRKPYERLRLLVTRFPRLAGLRVRVQKRRDWQGWVDPEVAPWVTHLILAPRNHPWRDCWVLPYPEALPGLISFRNLRQLTVGAKGA